VGGRPRARVPPVVVIDFDSLRLPPGYRIEYEATTVWALKNPDGHTVQRFSIHKSDNDHVWFYVRKDQRRRSGEES
jgi:hypothetical protein